jgi:hypothetical protein
LETASRALTMAREEIDARMAGAAPDDRYGPLIEVLLDTVDDVEGDSGAEGTSG